MGVFPAKEGEPNEGSDDPNDRMVKKEDDPTRGEKVATLATAGVDAFKWAKKTITGNWSTIAIVFREPKRREAFYLSTSLVDKTLNSPQLKNTLGVISKINSIGNYRADLVNYITDGTKPSSYREGMTDKEKAVYNNAVIAEGNAIMKQSNIEVKQ
jgi:hypothetical protein